MTVKLTRRAVLIHIVVAAALGSGCHNANEIPPCAREDVLDTPVEKPTAGADQMRATFKGEAHGHSGAECRCVVNSGMDVTFWNTGRGEWECDVETYERLYGSDATVTVALTVYDTAGKLLFTTASYASPEMDTPHAPYKWRQDFYFPKDKFTHMARCRRTVTCTHGGS